MGQQNKINTQLKTYETHTIVLNGYKYVNHASSALITYKKVLTATRMCTIVLQTEKCL